jgi:DNA-binding XRE family transcriptional regulator
MITMMSNSWSKTLREARRAAGLSQAELASLAGVSRMTLQKLEAGTIDPRLSTWTVLMRAVGLDVVLAPTELAPSVAEFLRSGGRIVGQPAGISAPASIVALIENATLDHLRKVRR